MKLFISFLIIQVVFQNTLSILEEFIPKVLQSTNDGSRIKILIKIENRSEEIEIFRRSKQMIAPKIVVSNKDAISIPEPRCYYEGVVIGDTDSRVYVKYNITLNGHIFYKGTSYVIMPMTNDTIEQNVHHVIPESDIESPSYECGHKDHQSKLLFQNRNLRSETPVAGTGPFYLKVSAVASFSLYSNTFYGKNDVTVTAYSIYDIFFKSSYHFSFVNITLIMVVLDIWTNEISNPAVPSTLDAQQILDIITDYRARVLIPRNDAHDQTTLFVDFKTEHAAGLAYIKTLCNQMYSSAWVRYGKHPYVYSAPFSHELGHNIGAQHDTGLCTCPGFAVCLMSPRATPRIDYRQQGFSDCSITAINEEKKNPFSCLHIPPKTSLKQVCGDKIVSGTEECDCGPPYDCAISGRDQFCDPYTCTFRTPAQCVYGSCCDANGRFTLGNVCRKGDGECIDDTVCSGTSAECPPYLYLKHIGASCGSGTGYCIDGECRTRQGECQKIWGPSISASTELCYQYNTHGTYYGNCGVDTNNGNAFIACHESHKDCGKMFCYLTSYDSSLAYTGESINGLCGYATSRDYSPNVYGMVRDFVPCGSSPGMVCHTHICASLADAIRVEHLLRRQSISGNDTLEIKDLFLDNQKRASKKYFVSPLQIIVIVLLAITAIAFLIATVLVTIRRNILRIKLTSSSSENTQI